MADNQLLETWQIHDRINLYLLDAVDAESLGSYSASKGRSVGEQFAHVHNVRLMWLKSAAPELLAGLKAWLTLDPRIPGKGVPPLRIDSYEISYLRLVLPSRLSRIEGENP